LFIGRTGVSDAGDGAVDDIGVNNLHHQDSFGTILPLRRLRNFTLT